MRIVAGRHRGRVIAAPPGDAVRPTADRVRENLFNILSHGRLARCGRSPILEARVLDAFAGSGALGLEALSRGAAHVLFLEQDRGVLAALDKNVTTLGEAARATLLEADACQPPVPANVRGNPEPRTLAFLDPPYRSGLATPALAALAAAGWLAPGAIAVIELDEAETWALPEGFSLADERRYGRTKLVFLEWLAG